MAIFLFVATVCFLGAFLQSAIGFGAAVLMVNVFSFVLIPSKAIVISQSTCILLNAYILIKTWPHIKWRILIPLLIPSLVSSFIATKLSLGIDVSMMKVFLGLLFIFLSIYFSCIASRIKVTPSTKSALCIGVLSGTMNGMFGSGGPPAILYLAPALEDKNEYLATGQLFFLCTNSMGFLVRVFSGSVERHDIPGILIGVVSGLLGAIIGMKCTKRLNGVLLKRFVYIFIGINGLIIVLKQLL